ncbi:MAG: phytanoyl-CoA dioxygenase family protein [Planctomycetes bacterium]|nr:phytanoyl-CoA dioxygenase family protein [Planctomycetota bacterium]
MSATVATRPAVVGYPRYQVPVGEYRAFREQGFLVVRGLVPAADVAELRAHTEDLMQGRLAEQMAQSGVDAPPAHLSAAEKAQHFVRLHMLHRKLALHERYLLHPRVLDVLQALIGPDLLALQTMLFLKPPGREGQGWHQDTYYIPTHPDTLCGAWIAIDDADEFNGAMWMASGSQVEPVYPSSAHGYGNKVLADLDRVERVSDMDDRVNGLAPIAAAYPHVLVPATAGDVVFFGGHVLHRSKPNSSAHRFRRAFVSHYCSARSFTDWGRDDSRGDPAANGCVDPATGMTNGSHILARGDTHLPYAQPRFGTPCAAVLTPAQRRAESAYNARPHLDSGSPGASGY